MRTNLTLRKVDRLHQGFQRIKLQGTQPETLGDNSDHLLIFRRVCRSIFIQILILIPFQFLDNLTSYQLQRTLGRSKTDKRATINQWRASDTHLSAGHARVLAGIADSELQGALFAKTLQFGWSVRQLEAAAKNAQTEKKEKPEREPLPIEYEELTERLRSATGLKVKLEGTQEKGKITLQYTSEEELQRLWEWMER